MSRFLKAAAEILAVVVGNVVGGPLGGAIAAAAVTVVETVTAPKPPKAVGNPMAWQSNPEAGIPHVMGRCYTGGQIVYRQAYGGDDKNETLITIYSTGPVRGFENLYVDGVVTPVSGSEAEINDRGKMQVSTQLGAQPEAAQLGALGPPDWTPASRLSGLAASSITLVYDSQGKTTFTTEPQCGYVVLGTPVYDPRQDGTYPGGSGPQRWNDETTWSFTGYDNPYLKALSYLIGYRQNGRLVIGVGRPIASILVDQFVDGANVADANGWTIGGTILSTDSKWVRLGDILACGGGVPLRHGASIGCMVNTPRVSLATIESADVIGDWSVQATQSRRDRINAIVPRYMAEQSVTVSDTSRKAVDGVYPLKTTVTWGMAAAAPIVVDAYVAFDGGQRQKGVDYPFVTGVAAGNMAPAQVAQLARYEIENAREFGPITLPLKPRWMGYRPGDVLTCGQSMTEQGLAEQQVLILKRERDPETMTVTMTARSETPAKHAFALGQTTGAPATPSVSLRAIPAPQAGDWSAAGATISSAGGSLPALTLAGASASAVIDGIIVETRLHVAGQDDDAGWANATILPPSATRLDIAAVAPGAAYDVSVSYRWQAGTGERLILGPAIPGVLSTTGDVANLIVNSKPADGFAPSAAIDSGGTTATVTIPGHGRVYQDKTVAVAAGTVAGLELGTYYALFYDDAARAGGGVAFLASTNPDDALPATMAHPGRHYLGYITTPEAGSTGGSTGGGAGGGGGVGAGRHANAA